MDLNDLVDFSSKRNAIILIITAVVLIAISGVFFSLSYFVMDKVHTALLSTTCVIENNAFFGSCQDMFTMIIYPFLNAKYILVWLSFFFIIALSTGMLLFGYQSGTRPSMLGLLIVIELMITYGSIHIANIYRTLLDNPIMLQAMTPFTVYNKIMLNFPWFVFVISLFAVALGIINWQKTPVNNPTNELDF